MAVTAWSSRAAGAVLLSLRLLQCALCSVGIGVCSAQPATTPAEFPTAWEVPPGNPAELEGAGLAKILCSAVFITGRSLATAMEEDGFFVSPLAGRRAIKSVAIDSQEHAVRVTLPDGVTRSAKLYGDQGCVTLPRDRKSTRLNSSH